MTVADASIRDQQLRTRSTKEGGALRAARWSIGAVCLGGVIPALHTGQATAQKVEDALPAGQAAELDVFQLMRRVDHLQASLAADWGGAGSEAIDPAVSEAVRGFLQRLLWGFHPLPTVVSPTFEGGLQLEWVRGRREFEAEWRPDGVLAFLLNDEETDREVEDELRWSEAETLLAPLRWLAHG